MGLFGLFDRGEWMPETLAELRGSFAGLAVTVRNVPCLRDAKSGARKYAYADFGGAFLTALHQGLGDFDRLCDRLKTGGTASAVVELPALPPIVVELRGAPAGSRRKYDSDLADALIEAFESAGLRP